MNGASVIKLQDGGIKDILLFEILLQTRAEYFNESLFDEASGRSVNVI
jgi:hypothetical protein